MAIRAVGTDKNGTRSIGYLRRYKNAGSESIENHRKRVSGYLNLEVVKYLMEGKT
jgi:hypothetical protein